MLISITLYCLLIVLISIGGGLTPLVMRLTHRRMQLATSVIAGFMLGVAVLHLLPHALGSIAIDSAMGWMLGGVLAMFFLERFFSFHHHDAPGGADPPAITADPWGEEGSRGQGAQGPSGESGEEITLPSRMSWMGMGVGLVIHSMVSGAVLAAAVRAESDGGGGALMPGLAVFLIVGLHKPFDAMALMTLLRGAGYRPRTQHMVNVGFALAVPLGAVGFMVGLAGYSATPSPLIGPTLALAAGIFLCIALADLLPEVHFHKHDRLLLSLALVLGLALAWILHEAEALLH